MNFIMGHDRGNGVGEKSFKKGSTGAGVAFDLATGGTDNT